MDPLSVTVSIVTLIDASYRLCDLISDLRDGGKERMKLLREVSNLCCTLDSLKEKFDASGVKETTLSRTLNQDNGPIHQCAEIVNDLTKKLISSPNIAGRFAQRLKWNFDKQEVLQAVEQLHRVQATITNALQQATHTIVERIQLDANVAFGIVQEQYSKKIRDWLSPLNFAAQQKALYDGHCSGTGSGFLQSNAFHVFQKSKNLLMWCRGPPGAGKTYLSSIIAHHLQNDVDSVEGRDKVLVVYCRYDDPDCKVVINIIGDLLKQCLGSQGLPQNLINLYTKYTLSDTKPTLEELVLVLGEQLREFRHCHIIIDALDEFGTRDECASLVDAIVLLRQTLKGGTANRHADAVQLSFPPEYCSISLLIMSRDIHIGHTLKTAWLNDRGDESTQAISDYRCYELSPDKGDIRRYLDWRIENDLSLRVMTGQRYGLKDEILSSIVDGSGSMFLLAKLMVDDIASCLTIKELRRSLQKMPMGLKVAYDATLHRIRCQGQGRSLLAFEVMKWVIFARRPLLCAEIEHAVSIEMGTSELDLDDLISATNLAALCAGLIVIDQYDCFRFAHQTVSEYLSSTHVYASDGQNNSIADCCLTYLMYDVFSHGPARDISEFRDRISKYPLYGYCSSYWYEHLKNGPTSDQKKVALRFFGSEPHWRSSRQTARSGQTRGDEMLSHARLFGDVMLHHAAYLNAHHIFDDLLDIDRTALNARSELGRTPLMRAAVHHSVEFASKLIQAGADINAMDNIGDTALHLAIWKRNITMVKLILSTLSVQSGLLAETRLRYETSITRDSSGEITDLLIQDKANNQVLGFARKVAPAVTDDENDSDIDSDYSLDTSPSIVLLPPPKRHSRAFLSRWRARRSRNSSSDRTVSEAITSALGHINPDSSMRTAIQDSNQAKVMETST